MDLASRSTLVALGPASERGGIGGRTACGRWDGGFGSVRFCSVGGGDRGVGRSVEVRWTSPRARRWVLWAPVGARGIGGRTACGRWDGGFGSVRFCSVGRGDRGVGRSLEARWTSPRARCWVLWAPRRGAGHRREDGVWKVGRRVRVCSGLFGWARRGRPWPWRGSFPSSPRDSARFVLRESLTHFCSFRWVSCVGDFSAAEGRRGGVGWR